MDHPASTRFSLNADVVTICCSLLVIRILLFTFYVVFILFKLGYVYLGIINVNSFKEMYCYSLLLLTICKCKARKNLIERH